MFFKKGGHTRIPNKIIEQMPKAEAIWNAFYFGNFISFRGFVPVFRHRSSLAIGSPSRYYREKT